MSERFRKQSVRFKCPTCGVLIDIYLFDPYYHTDPKWCVECDKQLERVDK